MVTRYPVLKSSDKCQLYRKFCGMYILEVNIQNKSSVMIEFPFRLIDNTYFYYFSNKDKNSVVQEVLTFILVHSGYYDKNKGIGLWLLHDKILFFTFFIYKTCRIKTCVFLSSRLLCPLTSHGKDRKGARCLVL